MENLEDGSGAYFQGICSAKGTLLLVEELWEGSKAALIWLIAESTKKHVLVICGSADDRLYDDVSYFPVTAVDFPSWETLPGEEIAPSPDLVGNGAAWILHSIANGPLPHVILRRCKPCFKNFPLKKTFSRSLKRGKRGCLFPCFYSWKII